MFATVSLRDLPALTPRSPQIRRLVLTRFAVEARIRVLTQLLRHATVGEAPASTGVVEPGTVITATIQGDRSTFLIGSREIVGDSDLDVYSEGSPLGTAIIGLRVGDSTNYTAPNGASISVEILKVDTYVP